MGISELLAARPELADGWVHMQRAITGSALEPPLRQWVEQRARLLLGNSPVSPGASPVSPGVPPVPAIADYVEQYLLDVHAISDEQSEAVRSLLGDAGLVALAVAVGVIEAEVRLELMLT